MKKILTALLALLMLASVCVIGANAQSYSPLGGWKEAHETAEEAKITVKKADPADVIKDGVIGENEYEKLDIDQTEDNTPLNIMYITNDNLNDGLAMLETIEFYFSWDETHGFNFAIKDKPAVIQQLLSPAEGEKPGDDFANNTAFLINILTENGVAGTIDSDGWAHGTMEAKNYCVYYAVAKRTDTGAYIEGHYDVNQLGLSGNYDPEAETDYIINYTDDGYAIVEWSIPFSVIESGTVGAGSSIYACFTASAGNAGPEDEMYHDTYCIGLGDKTFMVDAKIDKAGAFPEFVLSDEAIKAPAVQFSDVPADAYFASPVNWAVSKNITQGTGAGKFSPEDPCTRGQVVTFLWRAAGSPTPTSSTNPFGDVKSDDYFYAPVIWAVENNITKGTSDVTFGPNETCTRGQIVTFLYRFANGSESSATNPFGDVKADDYFYAPVMWAVGNAITKGTSDTTFGPNETCTRAQVVTFLYRATADSNS